VRPAGAFAESRYIRIPNVPVFRAHRTRDNDGKPLIFGPKELQELAENCNRRIRESGDYAAVIVGHTSDKEDVIQRHPEVIGYAGPFRLGTMGQPGERQVYCILADFWIRKDKLDVYHAHPRRSAELWLQGETSFLDPIALLGGDPPRLDLGLAPEAKGGDGASVTDGSQYGGPRFFYAMRGNAKVLKYSMGAMGAVSAAPTAMNTSPLSANIRRKKHAAQSPGAKPMARETNARRESVVPTHRQQAIDAKEREDFRHREYAAGNGQNTESEEMAGTGGSSGISEDDLRRIVEAIMKTAPMEWVLKKMEESQGEGGINDELGGGEGEGEVGGEDALSGEAPGAEIPPDEGEDSGMPPVPESGEEELPPTAGEGEEFPGGGSEAGGEEHEDQEEPGKFAAGEHDPDKGAMAGEIDGWQTTEPKGKEVHYCASCKKKFAAEQSDPDKSHMTGAADGFQTTEPKKNAAKTIGPAGYETSDKKKFEAKNPPQGTTEKGGKDPGVSTGKTEPRGKNPPLAADGSAANRSQVKGEQTGAVKYSMANRLAALEKERLQRIEREWKLRLQQLSSYRIFDVNKEFDRVVKYARKNGYSEDWFASHVESIVENYQHAGLGTMPFPADMVATSPLPESPREANRPVQYSQASVDRAVKYCCQKREAGQDVDYASVLEKIERGQPLE
jgi:hypothetical protein